MLNLHHVNYYKPSLLAQCLVHKSDQVDTHCKEKKLFGTLNISIIDINGLVAKSMACIPECDFSILF